MRDGRGGRQKALRAARDQFRRHGFFALVERHVPGWTILHASYITGGPELVAESGDSFAIAAGTAAKGWLAELKLPHFDQSKLAGQLEPCCISAVGHSFSAIILRVFRSITTAS
jgi:hypothetical protein